MGAAMIGGSISLKDFWRDGLRWGLIILRDYLRRCCRLMERKDGYWSVVSEGLVNRLNQPDRLDGINKNASACKRLADARIVESASPSPSFFFSLPLFPLLGRIGSVDWVQRDGTPARGKKNRAGANNNIFHWTHWRGSLMGNALSKMDYDVTIPLECQLAANLRRQLIYRSRQKCNSRSDDFPSFFLSFFPSFFSHFLFIHLFNISATIEFIVSSSLACVRWATLWWKSSTLWKFPTWLAWARAPEPTFSSASGWIIRSAAWDSSSSTALPVQPESWNISETRSKQTHRRQEKNLKKQRKNQERKKEIFKRFNLNRVLACKWDLVTSGWMVTYI